MLFDDIQVKIVEQPGRFEKALYIYSVTHDKKISVLYSDEEKTFDYGTEPKPTLLLRTDQLQALFDVLAANGMKPRDLGKVEGLYEAQNEHLKDLRKLLKL